MDTTPAPRRTFPDEKYLNRLYEFRKTLDTNIYKAASKGLVEDRDEDGINDGEKYFDQLLEAAQVIVRRVTEFKAEVIAPYYERQKVDHKAFIAELVEGKVAPRLEQALVCRPMCVESDTSQMTPAQVKRLECLSSYLRFYADRETISPFFSDQLDGFWRTVADRALMNIPDALADVTVEDAEVLKHLCHDYEGMHRAWRAGLHKSNKRSRKTTD